MLYRSPPHPAAIIRTIRLLIMDIILYRAFRKVIPIHQMSFNDKIEALRRRMDGGGAGHQQRAAGNDRRIDNDPHSRIAQQLAASGLTIHTISIVLNLIMTRQ